MGHISFAQVKFQRTYKMTWSDGGSSLAIPTKDSTGYFFETLTSDPSVSYYDVCLLKTNLLGDTIWTKYYGGGGTKGFSKFHQLQSGDITMIGGTYGFGSGSLDGYLVKINSIGDTVWTKAIGNNLYNAVLKSIYLDNGNYAMLMYSDSSLLGRDDSGIIIVDSSGNHVWNKFFEGGNMNNCGDMADFTNLNDGGYILNGYSTIYSAGNTDFYAIRTDSLGNLLWAKSYGGLLDDASTSLAMSSGGIIIGGTTKNFGAVGSDILLLKIDFSGNVIWAKTYRTPLDESVTRIIKTSDGGFIVGGYGPHVTTSSDRKGFLMKIDSTGIVQWSKSYGSSLCNDDLANLNLAPDGGYLFSGSSCSFGSSWKSYIIKTDSIGNSGCYQQNESFVVTDVTSSIITNNWSPASYYDSSIISKPTSTIVTNYGDSLIAGTLCFISSVNEINQEEQNVKVYPNPNDGNFNFECKLKLNEKGELQIFDITGRMIQSYKLTSNNNSINLNSGTLNAGTYLYKYLVNGSVCNVDKLVIIK